MNLSTMPRRWLPALVLAAVASGAAAHGDHEHAGHGPQAPQPAAAPASARVKLPDTALLDQDGRRLSLRHDVAGDHIVVVDFVYTSCTTICPVMSALLAQLQPRLGADVRLVSVSLDPLRDTPAVLKAYAARHGAGPGWTWLTGTPAAVDEVLRGFDAWVPDYTQHPPQVLVGDARSGRWTRFGGFPDPGQLLARVDELRRERAASAR